MFWFCMLTDEWGNSVRNIFAYVNKGVFQKQSLNELWRLVWVCTPVHFIRLVVVSKSFIKCLKQAILQLSRPIFATFKKNFPLRPYARMHGTARTVFVQKLTKTVNFLKKIINRRKNLFLRVAVFFWGNNLLHLSH